MYNKQKLHQIINDLNLLKKSIPEQYTNTDY